ncbi:MAG TPA: hypothetical protein VFO07_19925 [Roseiflexaceae bacterium]|nr:hypothetical protein [Roseiflexaceae bacterium]
MSAINWGALVGLALLLLLVFFKIVPAIHHSRITRAGQRLIREIEARRGSKVILMIERQEIASPLGKSRSHSLGIEDPVEVLRAIRLTLPHVPIDLIVHTTGRMALMAEPIANGLVRHDGPVTLMVPYYAMSGGARLALASDKVLMSRSAVLGPETRATGSRPCLGVLEALAEVLSDGCWIHSAPITFDIARELGMPVSNELPAEAYQLVELYSQPASQSSPVQLDLMPSPSEDAHIPESEKA